MGRKVDGLRWIVILLFKEFRSFAFLPLALPTELQGGMALLAYFTTGATGGFSLVGLCR
jgi:hypothetical protein